MSAAARARISARDRAAGRGVVTMAVLMIGAGATLPAAVGPVATGRLVDRAAPRLDVRLPINAAPADDLAALPGVGPVLAERIVADREAAGPFGSIDELERVPGIGPRRVEQMRPHLVLERRGAGPERAP